MRGLYVGMNGISGCMLKKIHSVKAWKVKIVEDSADLKKIEDGNGRVWTSGTQIIGTRGLLFKSTNSYR